MKMLGFYEMVGSGRNYVYQWRADKTLSMSVNDQYLWNKANIDGFKLIKTRLKQVA